LKHWTNKRRPSRLRQTIWHEYIYEQRTLEQLSRSLGKSIPWIRKQLANYRPKPIEHCPRSITLIIDATYFGRSWGVLVAIDATSGAVVYYSFLDSTERVLDYEVALDTLESLGYTVEAIVIDGQRGVRQMAQRKGITVQHCQFHQLLTITQCLTRNPQLPANVELRAIALTLTRTNERVLTDYLDAWHVTWGAWLKEQYIDSLGRTRYHHSRTRRAYFSLKRNLPHLFTYQEEGHKNKHIPNTTNRLDGQFGVWKMALKRHRGAKKLLVTKILLSFFSRVKK